MSMRNSGGARALKLGGLGACSPGKILKSGLPEMQFPGFSG